MPRYAYRCLECNAEFLTIHSSEEKLDVCQECKKPGTLIKLLTTPSYAFKKKHNIKKTGQVTEEFIEEAQQDLKKQRDELKKQR